MIPSLGEWRDFDALITMKKIKISISRCFGNFSFSHGSLVKPFKQERVTLL